MYPSPEFMQQVTDDRHRERRASVSAHRLAGSSGTRTRVARSLRRVADRLDGTTSPTATSGAQAPLGRLARLDRRDSLTV
jgi:hypothetical protein